MATIVGDGTAERIVGTNDADDLSGLGGNDQLIGLGGDDILRGGADNDRLVGGTGDDEMIGGEGDDFYIVEDAGDVTTEIADEGDDSVQTTITFALGANIEKLAFEKSIDPTAKRNRGDLGYFTWGAMVPEFQEAAFELDRKSQLDHCGCGIL